MAKALKTQKAVPEIEVEPGAWERFRRAIRVAVKAGPQHRKAKPKRARKINAVLVFLVILMSPLAAHATTWIACTFIDENDINGTMHPVSQATPDIYVIDDNQKLLSQYDRAAKALHEIVPALVEPSQATYQFGAVTIVIDRQTGAYAARTVHGYREDGSCVVMAPQPILKPKF